MSTDDPEIAQVARKAGAIVPFLRPAELALDDTPTAPVVRHALEWCRGRGGPEPDLVLVLEPTSPGRRPFHIQEAVRLLAQPGVDSVASVCQVPHHYVPQKLLRLAEDGSLIGNDGTHPRTMVHRRQDLPMVFAFDGAIFSCRTAWLLRDPPTLWGDRTRGYPIDPRYCVDLDRPEDWEAAEARLRAVLMEGERACKKSDLAAW